MLVPADEVAQTALRALSAVAPPEHARDQADHLIEAELRGISSHGILRLPRILRRISNKVADPVATGDHVWRSGGFLAVDGQKGLGPVVALRAIDALEQRVKQTGTAVAAINNSNHIGMLGYYAERAARRGHSMIILSTSEALVHPWGGKRAMIGTNPIAIGLPIGREEIFMMDTATGVVSMGEIHDRANRGEPIPIGWAVDKEGNPTTDASAAKSGAIAPFGGAKGYALGLAFELLVTSLAGAAVGRQVVGTLDDDRICNKGDLIILIDGPSTDLRAYLEALRSEEPADGFAEVIIPGERGREARAQRLRDGIEVPDRLWREICGFDGVATGGLKK